MYIHTHMQTHTHSVLSIQQKHLSQPWAAMDIELTSKVSPVVTKPKDKEELAQKRTGCLRQAGSGRKQFAIFNQVQRYIDKREQMIWQQKFQQKYKLLGWLTPWLNSP